MEHKKIVIPSLSFFQDELKGEGVVKSRRTLGELAGIFENQDAYSQLPLDQLAYEVYSYLPEREGTPGGLYFGITQLYPGKVGDEYFMTKGHFHQQEDRSEYYWGLEGEGMLILMDRERRRLTCGIASSWVISQSSSWSFAISGSPPEKMISSSCGCAAM